MRQWTAANPLQTVSHPRRDISCPSTAAYFQYDWGVQLCRPHFGTALLSLSLSVLLTPSLSPFLVVYIFLLHQNLAYTPPRVYMFLALLVSCAVLSPSNSTSALPPFLPFIFPCSITFSYQFPQAVVNVAFFFNQRDCRGKISYRCEFM